MHIQEVQPSREAIRFGVFELDARSGELRKQGVKIKLQDQPLQILQILLEHPAEVITREQLQKRIWPSDTFVDFDHGLYNAVKKLREALGDVATTPRFVETLPKRGYRFIGTVNGAANPTQAAQTLPQTSAGPPKHLVAALTAASSIGLIFGLLFAFNAGGVRDRLLGRSYPPVIHSLAVLPLRNLSGDQGQEYFADAMTEELITELSRIGALRVISQTSVMRYRQTDKPLPEIARELNIDGIVEGSVLRSGDRVRINAQLIYAPTDTNLWAQTYDRDLRDVLTLQSTVAGTIAEEIRVRMSPQQLSRFKSVRPLNRKALEAYLEGRLHLDKARPLEFHEGQEKAFDEEIRKAVASFQKATQEEPSYVPAYLGIFDAVGSPGIVPHPEFIPAARQALTKALESDDSLVDAHLDMARLLMQWDYDYAGAGREYRRALEMNPNSADAHAQYADYLQALGSYDEGKKEHELAQELDPTHDRLTDSGTGIQILSLDQSRQYLDEKDPRDPFAITALGKDYQTGGRYREAVEQYIKGVDLYGYHDQAALLRRGYTKGDYKGAIRDWMAQWERLSRHQYLPPFWPAFLYANLGDKDAAFRWLERAYKEHSWCMLYLNEDTMWNPIRDDPRFAEFVRLAGLPADHGQFTKERENALLIK